MDIEKWRIDMVKALVDLNLAQNALREDMARMESRLMVDAARREDALKAHLAEVLGPKKKPAVRAKRETRQLVIPQ